MAWHLYIIECKDKTLYTGITNDLTRRIDEHNQGKGAKYTKYRRPVELVYSKKLANHSLAAQVESSIKKLTSCFGLIQF